MEQTGSDVAKPALGSGVGLLERVQERRWTLKLAAAVLYGDLVLVWRTGQGIIDWSASTDQLLANSGFLVVSVTVFGLLMSIGMPALAGIVKTLAMDVASHLPSWTDAEKRFRQPMGCVRPWEVRKHALETSDKLLLDLHAAHESKHTENDRAMAATGQVAFSLLLLGILDTFPFLLGLQGNTLLQSISSSFGSTGDVGLLVGLLFTLGTLKWAWLSDHEPGWIYHPPLYELTRPRRGQ